MMTMKINVLALVATLGCVQTVECPGGNNGDGNGGTGGADTLATGTATSEPVACEMPLAFNAFQYCNVPTCCAEMTQEQLDTFCISNVDKVLGSAVACTKHPYPGPDTDYRECKETNIILHCEGDGYPYAIECCEPK